MLAVHLTVLCVSALLRLEENPVTLSADTEQRSPFHKESADPQEVKDSCQDLLPLGSQHKLLSRRQLQPHHAPFP